MAVVALAGCGGGGAPGRVPDAVAREVRGVFADYTAAMGAQDYETACRHLAPESIAKLRKDVAAVRRDAPAACPAVLRLLYDAATPRERREVGEVARTVHV